MRYLLIGLMGASLTLVGCSKERGLSTEELVIEGGGDPDGETAYPATLYGTLNWPYELGLAFIYVFDDDGTLIAQDTSWVTLDGYAYDLCDDNMTTESPLPWTVCAQAEYATTWRYATVTVTALDQRYACGLIYKKAKQVNLSVVGYGSCGE